MATAKATLVYDTYVNSQKKNENYDASTRLLMASKYRFAVLQFDVPALPDTVINSAKLRLYFYAVVAKSKITASLYDHSSRLDNLTYNDFAPILDKKLLTSTGSYTAEETVWTDYDEWIEIDVTNLVIGNLGKKNLTLSVNHTSPNNGAFESSRESHPPELVIDYQNATPFLPTILYPNGEVVENAGTLRFEWRHNTSGGSAQTKFELGWKMQSSQSWNTITQSTAAQYYDIDAAKFQNGIVEWRVRTYNTKGLASDYATAQFFVVGKPGNPSIASIKNDAITEIAWTANKSEEASARLEILKDGKVLISSGEVAAGIDDVWKPNIMLSNGAYVVTLEISNIYGIWSGKIAKTFNIGAAAPSKPDLKIYNQGDNVRLEYTGPDVEYFIYRSEDGGEFIPIARTPVKSYTDYGVKSKSRYAYYIRAYNGGYSDSDKKDTAVMYRGYIISDSSGAERIAAYLSEEEYINLDVAKELDATLARYIGREYPVREASGFKTQSVGLSFFVYDRDYERLEIIFDKNAPVCIRSDGIRIWCSVNQYSASKNKLFGGYTVDLTGERIDYKEVVDYA